MREISLDDLAGAGARQAQVVDVRESTEYVSGHVPGARSIPMGQLSARLGELDRSRPVYVVCASGNRSSAMTEVLDAQGFEAHNVPGGTKAWIADGRPVETGSAR